MKKRIVNILTGGGGSLLTAFTMAEILLSLTIIGVVAAITLPSLTGNINERTWNTQRKALYARFSQAISLMPALNGYGTYRPASGTAGTESYNAGEDNVAETFITAGLAKVLKINNICDNDHLTDCGFNEKWIALNGTSLSLPKKLSDLNAGVTANTLKVINTKAAAFETVNGESVLVFYNPNCQAANVLVAESSGLGAGYYVKQHLCANFVFDLNGAKGPNTVGKDIGFLSAIYPSDTSVVLPQAGKLLSSQYKHSEASKACANLDSEYRLPNIEEAISLYYNGNLTGAQGNSWTSSVVDSGHAWYMGYSIGLKYSLARDTNHPVFCVRR